MARYKEYGYDIQNGKAIIPEWGDRDKDDNNIINNNEIYE